MTDFELEEIWFNQLIRHLEKEMKIPVVTTSYAFVGTPCLCVEKKLGSFSFARLRLDVVFQFFFDHEMDKQESETVKKLRTVLSKPLLLKVGVSHIKVTDISRKVVEKKIRNTTITSQAFSSINLFLE